ncbi:MAG: HIT family protein [Candidatus Gracilibacteria bacterium]|nr:HIT family protein [Candidatus Gracilibacteria bacterium]
MCELCKTVSEEYRLIKETKYSFCIICQDPLKLGHVMVLPKRHVTQTNMSDLSPEESHDLICLLDEIQEVIENLSEDSAIILKNNGKHITQAHLHFHIFPSKGYLRNLVGSFENIPERKCISREEYVTMRNIIQGNINIIK